MRIKHSIMTALAAASLLLAGCATVGTRLIPELLEQVGPSAAALLGPDVEQVVHLLQSRGATAVERAYDINLAHLEQRILRGEIGSAEGAQKAYEKASARMKLIRQLRRGNDYTQMIQTLGPADRAALELSRRTVDVRYEAVRIALIDLGAIEGGSAACAARCAGVSLAAVGMGIVPAADAASGSLSWADVIGLCRAAILDGETARVAARLSQMSEQDRRAASVVCAAYAEGIKDARGNLPVGASRTI